MQTNWQNFCAHENAPKRSLFVNGFSGRPVIFADRSWPDLEYSSTIFVAFSCWFVIQDRVFARVFTGLRIVADAR
jgi:hypothetical protein